MSVWQEYCEQRDKLHLLIDPSSYLQQALGLVFPQAPLMTFTPPFALLPAGADTPAVPMRLAQAPAQMALVENSLGLLGQDLFASPTLLPDANIPFLIPPPSGYNDPASFSIPNAPCHTKDFGYTPMEATFGSQSPSVSTSSVPIPPVEDVFTSDGASNRPQACLESFRALDAGLHPSQADNQDDWSKWLANF